MRILFLLRLWPVYGGGETVTRTLANEMVKKGWDVHISYFKDNYCEPSPKIDHRIILHKLDNIHCDEFASDLRDAELVNNQIINIIRKEGIDVVINQWLPVEYIRNIKLFCNVKVVKCHHTAFYNPIFSGNLIEKALKYIFKPFYLAKKKKQSIEEVHSFLPYVDLFVFLSPLFSEQYFNFSGDYNNKKICAIPNPLVYSSNYKKENLAHKKNTVLFVGRLVEGCKRVSLILKAWKIIENKNRRKDWVLKIVGTGPDIDFYKQLSEKLQLKNVQFEGFQNPIKYYEESKLFLMTSSFEGFGMTLLEAEQFGVVPIAMDSYLALHDIVTNGYNGFITPDNDIEAFAKAIATLMNDEKLRIKMAIDALDDCKRFDVDFIFDIWNKKLSI